MLTLDIYSPEKQFFEKMPILDITVTTLEGKIQILPDHIDMICELDIGPYIFTSEAKKTYQGIMTYGYLEIYNQHVSIYADLVDLKDKIDPKRALHAKETALSMLMGQLLDETQFQRTQLKLRRAQARLSLFQEQA